MNTVYIALGSNINPRSAYLNQAIDNLRLSEHIFVISYSPIYETEPVGYLEQENFLNMVIEIETSLEPLDLLNYCKGIEKKIGRKRGVRWGPRVIDLDILLYNQENIRTEQLIVPHPRMHERAFVLIPLKDVNPSLNIPSLNKSVASVLDEVTTQEKKGVYKWYPSNGENE
ncbi:2-amino-4-hydroxy-6-hydroxymethyldihydropteridine diphosphokinase [Aquibacillus rhizosphaerae]|uniref:2-amino-4-hydroxy-6-hydroxymethyldihydropteridine diphosphokinase n=1 Tax=Aquibacillus rhizosphaerae TaxID=3051431 RepID=A0ABT7L3R4_9BACI|nr:2-amino-4-hydroxy-6-hydroxymethyldihydropteridine diphosphokinase [Aquibacillus sp. LR5S19]MDL4840509.1 2-amino-4-hydroxy-6-hydroxymethyldihydropteridine diphosphokinase [Aquibacillus sp. LR5S19]